MRTANILFISVNRHQKRYFQWLGAGLAARYNIHYVHYTANFLNGIFPPAQLPEGVEITPAEIDEITSFLRIKAAYRDFGPLRQWLHSRQYLTRQAWAAVNYFADYLETKAIDLVCVWNGTLVPLAAATLVARKTGRKTLFFENGYLPGTTTVDPCGVNYKNSLVGKTRHFYEAVQIDPDKLALLYRQEQSVRPLKQKWYHRLFKRQPKGRPEPVTLPERYVFLPFQVHDDTQVLLHSPTIKTMFQLVDYVLPAVLRHNEKTGDKLWVIAKEHPSDFGRIDYGEIKEKYKDFPVIFLRYYPTPALIKGAKGIITLNSSVGIEALLHHKPVITLGNAFYNVPGLVKHVTPPEDLADALGIIDCPPDDNLIDKFLYYLRYHYLVDGSWRSPDERHLRSVEAKIRAVIETR